MAHIDLWNYVHQDNHPLFSSVLWHQAATYIFYRDHPQSNGGEFNMMLSYAKNVMPRIAKWAEDLAAKFAAEEAMKAASTPPVEVAQ